MSKYPIYEKLETMINVDYTSEAAIVELLSNVFNSIAYMDPETVRNNIEMGSEGGMSRQDRSIEKQLADYLLENFAYIYVGLIVNMDFRNAFMEAVSVEITLDKKDAAFVQEIRAQMNADKEPNSGDLYLFDFGIGKYDDKIYRWINGRLANSFDRLSFSSDTIDEFVKQLSEDDLIDIGFCISNFMYLMRAFSKNNLFFQYVRAVIDSVIARLI